MMISSSTISTRAFGILSAPLLIFQLVKRYPEFRSMRIAELDNTFKLLHKHPDELEAERRGPAEVEPFRKSHAVVPDGERVLPFVPCLEVNHDLPLPSVRERILQAVGDELVDDQPA